MVNLGFEADLTFILDKLPSEAMEGEDQGEQMDVDGETMVKKGRNRVTTLFSATMPPPVERLAKKYLKKPAIITIGEAGRAVDTVEQNVEFVQGDEKKKQAVFLRSRWNETDPNRFQTADVGDPQQGRFPFAHHRLRQPEEDGGYGRQRSHPWGRQSIRFISCFRASHRVILQWNASTLHSGKNQEQREAALQALRSGDADILVATDLAGRGIDVPDVSLVINYQMSNTIEAYIHRIGRTGRAGKQGTAITFLSNDDDEVMYDLKQGAFADTVAL